MQFELPFLPGRRVAASPGEAWLRVGAGQVRLWLVRNQRARRYVLRLRPDGTARVTIPRGGSVTEARRFAERNSAWLERQLIRRAATPPEPRSWTVGTEVLFRGELLRLAAGVPGETSLVRLGPETIRCRDLAADLRPEVEMHLRRLAQVELSARAKDLAALHQVQFNRVSVRNQRSRWGSCSRRGTLSLNWRLLQAPPFVRDYIILHELAHVKEMNHSKRFWREVQRLCPEFATAEHWLKSHGKLLR